MNNAMRSQAIDTAMAKAWNIFVSQRGKAFGIMILGALLAFEVFNYSTTDFALNDVLGNLRFMGIQWSTILAIAFCGIDFAGIARMFTPAQTAAEEPAEVWYLFGAWILAAAMNATLTWWGVSVAIANHTSQGSAILGNDTIRNFVPVFVAVMVWVIRILIIGTFSIAGERMFSHTDSRPRRASNGSDYPRTAVPQKSMQPAPIARQSYNQPYQPQTARPAQATPQPRSANPSASRAVQRPATIIKPAPKPQPQPENNRPEPTYHNLITARQLQEYNEQT